MSWFERNRMTNDDCPLLIFFVVQRFVHSCQEKTFSALPRDQTMNRRTPMKLPTRRYDQERHQPSRLERNEDLH